MRKVSENRAVHPEPHVLHSFVLGLLNSSEMDEVERHVENCDFCCKMSLAVPDDRLVTLLRRRETSANSRHEDEA